MINQRLENERPGECYQSTRPFIFQLLISYSTGSVHFLIETA